MVKPLRPINITPSQDPNFQWCTTFKPVGAPDYKNPQIACGSHVFQRETMTIPITTILTILSKLDTGQCP